MDKLFGDLIKPNSAEYAVGLDLTDTYSQLSYGLIDGGEVETFSMVAGDTDYLVPTALFKRREVSQWYAGADAVKHKEDDGFYVDGLVSKAMNNEEIAVGDEVYQPAKLLALFIKRLLGQANVLVPTNRIGSFMVSVETITPVMVEVLSEALKNLGLKTRNVFFQSHRESFYYYTIYSPRELWKHDVMLFDFSKDNLMSYNMLCNKNTTPIVVFIDNKQHSLEVKDVQSIEPGSFQARAIDEGFLRLISRLTNTRIYSSIYLIGENFKQEIFEESVKELCRKGHVYSGNNLYSKGAAYSAKNKVATTILSNNHVFLGNDKLKANVGINVLKRGERAYLPLLDAGTNWFEAYQERDIILNVANKISLVITPLTGKNPKIVDITLDELPKRPAKTTRLKLSVKMLEENKMQVHIVDMGFGELYPANGTEWNEEVEL